MPRDDEDDMRWTRVGFINQGRFCDSMASYVYARAKGPTLPNHWTYKTPDAFVEEFGTGIRWAKAGSYHCLYANGVPVFRIWTDTKANHTLCDVSNPIAHALCGVVDVFPVKKGSLAKCRPFTQRFKLTSEAEADALLWVAKEIYVLDTI